VQPGKLSVTPSSVQKPTSSIYHETYAE